MYLLLGKLSHGQQAQCLIGTHVSGYRTDGAMHARFSYQIIPWMHSL